MSTVTISLAKALKLKNRLAGRLAQLTHRFQTENSVLASKFDSAPLEAVFHTRADITEALVALKTSIYKANIDIQERLYKLAEVKSEISVYNALNVVEGVVPSHYREKDDVYKAFITKEAKNEGVRLFEKAADALQDEIDEYNIRTKITIPQSTIDLAS